MTVALILVLAQTIDPSEVSGSALAVYGIAAPFAILCLALAYLFRKERDDARGELRAKDERINELHQQALQREQQLVAGLGPRIYDAALLYREGTKLAEQVSSPPPAAPPVPGVEHRLEELTGLVERLVEGMGNGDGHGPDAAT